MIVQKGNRQLKISEEKLDEFLQMGYSQIDEKGKVVQVGKAITYDDIKGENETLKTAINNLTVENEKLKADNEKLKKENAKLKKEPVAE